MSSQLRRPASDSDSESESDSEEEETQSKVNIKQQEPPKKQEQSEAESESASGTDSDSEPESQFKVLKRDANSKVVTKAPVTDNKRGRDTNGAKGAPVEEPSTKKRKGDKDDKARAEPEKVLSPAKKVEKSEHGTRGTKAIPAAAKATTAGAAKTVLGVPASKVENPKPQAPGRKRKASTPPLPSRQQAQKAEVEKSSPVKPKKPFSWTTAAEESLVNELHKDHSNGLAIPNTKSDSYWEKLLKRLPIEGDMTELQLSDKVRRMRSRYHTLKERPKGEGGKLFKSPHEGKIFQLWEEIWGPAAKTPQPAAEEEDSEDSSAETKAAPAQVIKSAAVQVNQEDSTSEDEEENEEEKANNGNQSVASLNQINADGKQIPEPHVVSPFISKPKLVFTPRFPKEDKRNVFKQIEELASGQQEQGVAKDDEDKGDGVSFANEHLKRLRDETLVFFQELRGNCFQAMEDQRNGSLTGGLGNFAFVGKGFGLPGIPAGFIPGGGSQAAVELQKKWREHKIQELALLSERLQLLQEQCRLQIEELKLQNQSLE